MTRPGFDENWPDDGRPSKIVMEIACLDNHLMWLKIRRNAALGSIGLLGTGAVIGECIKALGLW